VCIQFRDVETRLMINGIVMQKQRCVVFATEAFRPAVIALGGFIQEQIPWLQLHLDGLTVKSLDDQGPGFRPLGGVVVHVKDRRNHVRVVTIRVHVEFGRAVCQRYERQTYK